MDGLYNADLLKLRRSEETKTPRRYLIFSETEGNWVSLPNIALGMSVADFINFAKLENATLDNQTIVFLWLIDRIGIDPIPQDLMLQIRAAIAENITDDNYHDWVRRTYLSYLRLDQEKLDLLQEDLNIFEGVQPLPVTKPELDRITLGGIVGVDSLAGLDLLNESIVSPELPIIIFIDLNGEATVKLYEPPVGQSKPDFQNLVSGLSETQQRNTVYFFSTQRPFKISFGPPNAPTRTPEDTYVPKPNELTFTVLDRDQETLVARRLIESHTPLRMEALYTREVTSTINIVGMALQPSLFLTTILANGRIARYLYIDETREPFLERSRYTLNYRRPFNNEPFKEVNYNMSLVGLQSIASQNLTISYRGQNEQTVAQDDIPYIALTLKTPNEETRDYFIPHLVDLFSYIFQEQAQIEPVLTTWAGSVPTSGNITPRTSTGLSVSSRLSGMSVGRRKIFTLKRVAGDLFATNYAKQCTPDKQPDLIPEDRINNWTSQRFFHGGQWHNRMVVPLPSLQNPKYWIGCPNDEYPFPGVKDNVLSNAEEFPVIPCCYAIDQNVPEKRLWKYLNNQAVEQKAKGTHVLVGSSLLEYRRFGIAPTNISTVLQQIMGEKASFVRYGTVISPNSFFHAILIATNNPEYVALQSDAEREAFVLAFRRGLRARFSGLDKIYTNVAAQELYDLTENQIIDEICGETQEGLKVAIYADPKRLYRLLEAIFGIRIFMFEITKADGEGFALPRCRFYSLYEAPDDRNVVMVLIHHGATVNRSIEFAQCELIGYGEGASLLFHSSFTQPLLNIIKACQNNSTVRVGNVPVGPPSTYTVHTINEYFDPNVSFNTPEVKITAQELDSAGKGSGVWLSIGDAQVCLITPPFSPLNLPRKAMSVNTTQGQNAMIQLLSKSGIKPVSPRGGSPSGGPPEGGLWFVFNNQARIYLPGVTEPQEGLEKLLLIDAKKPSEVDLKIVKVRKTEREASLMVQLVIYLYILYAFTNNFNETDPAGVPGFWRDHTFVEPGEYDWTVGRLLPIAEELNGVFALLSIEMPTLVPPPGAKIRFQSQNLSNRMQNTLTIWALSHRGDRITIPEYLDNYYHNESNFIQRPNQRIFLNWDDYQGWLRYVGSEIVKIHDKISINDNVRDEPFLYRNSPDNKIWLIQNVSDGDWLRAVAVGVKWRQSKINEGYRTPPYANTSLPIFNTYNLDTNGRIQISGVYNKDAISILVYEQGTVAALIDLSV